MRWVGGRSNWCDCPTRATGRLNWFRDHIDTEALTVDEVVSHIARDMKGK